MKTKSRTKNVLLNSFFGVICIFISLVFSYFVRVIFSKKLGIELFGVHSLFASIINTMLILELGISSTIVIFLYKPIENKNYETIKTYVHFFKIAYRYFCLFLLFLGIIIDVFFIQGLVHSTIPLFKIRIYFFMYLISIVLQYLWSYKKSLILAYQLNRVIIISNTLSDIIFSILETFILIKYKNYFLFLLFFIFQKSFSNIICNIYVNKNFPFINKTTTNKMNKDDKLAISKVIKPMFIQRISMQIQNTSTNLIIGLIGFNISIVGYLSNYQFIISGVQNLVSQLGAAFTTSFGSYSASTNNPEDLFTIYIQMKYAFFIISSIFSVCFFSLSQDFITLIFSSEYVLKDNTIKILTFYLFFNLSNIVNLSIQNALGIHRLDSKYMLAQTVLCLILSYFFGKFWGLNGILSGNILSLFIFSNINKGRILFKDLFNKSFNTFLFSFCKDLFSFIILFIFCSFINSYFQKVSWFILIIKAIIIVSFSVIMIFLLGYKRYEFSLIKKNLLIHLFQKNKKNSN